MSDSKDNVFIQQDDIEVAEIEVPTSDAGSMIDSISPDAPGLRARPSGLRNLNESRSNLSDLLNTSASSSIAFSPGRISDWKSIANSRYPSSTTGSVAGSFASSTGSSIRHRRLAPPPPSEISRSKRVRTDGPGSALDDDQISVVSCDSRAADNVIISIPSINHRIVDEERGKNASIPQGSYPEELLTCPSLLVGRKVEQYDRGAYVDTTFCSRSLLEYLMTLKYKVRKADTEEFTKVQDRMSDFSGGPIFQLSDATILANIDAVFKKCITAPIDSNGEPLVGSDELLYAADLEGYPGGFVEYILFRKKWNAKVFGFTEVKENVNYRLKETGHYTKESLEEWRGLSGGRGNGDILKPEFANKFAAHVRKVTKSRGLHVVVANGSVGTGSVDEDTKELLIKSTILAEVFIAMKTLRSGGTFVMKLYDMFTSYTVAIVYLLYRTFDKVTIFRPDACTYGSSERYVVCERFIVHARASDTGEIMNYLENCHQLEFQSRPMRRYQCDETAEIVQLLDIDIMRQSKSFFDYIVNSNENIGRQQIRETSDIINAIDARSTESFIYRHKQKILGKCRNVWGLPETLPQEDKYANLDCNETFKKLWKPYRIADLIDTERSGEFELMYDSLVDDIVSHKQWHFVHVGRDRGFYLSKGGDKVYRYVSGAWKIVSDYYDLACNTVIYADIVDEIEQYEGRQVVSSAMHIIDGLILGGKDIRNLTYAERMDCCTIFAASMNKQMTDRLMLIRAKIPQPLGEISKSFKEVHKRQILGRGDQKKKPIVPIEFSKYNSAVPHYALTGYLIIRTSKANSAHTDFLATLRNRLYLRINDNSNMDPHGPVIVEPPPGVAKTVRVDPATLVRFITQSVARGGGNK